MCEAHIPLNTVGSLSTLLKKSTRILDTVYGPCSTTVPNENTTYVSPATYIKIYESIANAESRQKTNIEYNKQPERLETMPSIVTNIISPSNRYVPEHPIDFSRKHQVDLTNDNLFNEQKQSEGTFVPFVSVPHYQSQLWFNRISKSNPAKRVPYCQNGENCAVNMVHNCNGNGPLHIFLFAEQERIFQQQGIVPCESRFCALCLGQNHQIQALTTQHCTNPKQQLNQNYRVVPPFNVHVGENGGIHPSQIISYEKGIKASNIPLIDNMVARFDPESKNIYVDISPLMWSSQIQKPLN